MLLDRELATAIGFGVLVATAVVLLAFVLAEISTQQFDSWCKPRGGHRVATGRGHALCISGDGRVIEP